MTKANPNNSIDVVYDVPSGGEINNEQFGFREPHAGGEVFCIFNFMDHLVGFAVL